VGNLGIVLSWLLIAAAALYDGYFAWQYRTALGSWEVNPFARWASDSFGLPAVLAFKAATVLFAAGITWYCARRNRTLAKGLTGVAGFMYLALSANYALSLARSPIDWPQADPLARVRSQPIARPLATLGCATATVNAVEQSGATLQAIEVVMPALNRPTVAAVAVHPNTAAVSGRGRPHSRSATSY
jgi:hypothetical protein